MVGMLFERELSLMWIRGEISNFVQAASGHWYFTLKDERAAVKGVMFRGKAASTGFVPRGGDKVEVRARVSLYEPRGDFQLQVDMMRRAGQGDLHEAFLRIKQKLESEGLFDPARKKTIPLFPKAIGVVTSLTAAALQDVLTALARRAPYVPVIIYPSLVQGQEAVASLMAALEQAGQRQEVDVLLLVRGGGSIEDLWSFNDEQLARLIARCSIPVISGVGHETDFTIADFVADLRAPTPTAAAELACVSGQDLSRRINHAVNVLNRIQQRQLEMAGMRLDRAASRLVSPAQLLLRYGQKNSYLLQSLEKSFRRKKDALQTRVTLLNNALQYNKPDIAKERVRVKQYTSRLHQLWSFQMSKRVAALEKLDSNLRNMNPRAILGRGFSITYDEFGNIVRDPAKLGANQKLRLELEKGIQNVVVIKDNPQELL
ncbi:exodeoxyribonuclease 7 large subunit [Advenella faeciporci]|uniref:Exodeoxyribonuclease 7 large subunit n=2 Tax=Advenella faeciporci TaxID=797535 RepID=A0A918MZW2_9BURK|nr:exodeoxyribonuclease 7 large subunit [Advenella faeciporci]